MRIEQTQEASVSGRVIGNTHASGIPLRNASVVCDDDAAGIGLDRALTRALIGRINRRGHHPAQLCRGHSEAESLSIDYDADIWISDGSQPRRLLRE